MHGTILLNYSDNIKQIENEEKMRFLKFILEQIGLPIEEIWTSDNLEPAQKIELSKLLNLYNINVYDDHAGALQIFVENEIVASWDKPVYKLKKYVNSPNKHKPYYFEMSINYWTLFEENTTNEK